jgi:Cytochrome c7 and related cytochrome c/Class III cytochrome C family
MAARSSYKWRAPPRLLSLFIVTTLVCVAQQSADEVTDPQPGPEQPIPYSHKTHLALGLKCSDCHANRDPGREMGIPEASKCMACHTTIAKDKPSIQKLAGLFKVKQPIPWIRVYSIPSGVTWSHRDHLKAGLNCKLCHGDVAQLAVMTRLMNVTTMDGCIGCHKDNQADASCGVCHEGK